MKTNIITAALAASVAIVGVAQAKEGARMSASQVRNMTLSTMGSGPGSAPGSTRPELVIWILLGIVAIAAIASTMAAGGDYPGMMVSDKALKTDIKRVGTSPQGFGIYEFRYKGHDQRIRGAMAQDVARLRPEAVSRHESGFLLVDYRLIDVRPALID